MRQRWRIAFLYIAVLVGFVFFAGAAPQAEALIATPVAHWTFDNTLADEIDNPNCAATSTAFVAGPNGVGTAIFMQDTPEAMLACDHGEDMTFNWSHDWDLSFALWVYIPDATEYPSWTHMIHTPPWSLGSSAFVLTLTDANTVRAIWLRTNQAIEEYIDLGALSEGWYHFVWIVSQHDGGFGADDYFEVYKDGVLVEKVLNDGDLGAAGDNTTGITYFTQKQGAGGDVDIEVDLTIDEFYVFSEVITQPDITELATLPQPVDEIEIQYPVDETENNEFGSWELLFSNPFSLHDDYDFFVDYGTTSSSLDHTDSTGLPFYIEVEDFLVLVPKSEALTVGQTYYARASVEPFGSSQVIATSSLIEFTIGPLFYDNTYYPTGGTESTSTELILTCDPDSGFFARSLCNLGITLFVPSAGSLDKFSTIWDNTKNKPPTGYALAAITAFNDIATSSPAFALSEISSVSTNVFGTLKTGLSWVLWIGFGILIIKRLGDLHI